LEEEYTMSSAGVKENWGIDLTPSQNMEYIIEAVILTGKAKI
jgi:hypothetical protein